MKKLNKKQEGSVAIEYVALLAGIAFGLFVVVTNFGSSLRSGFEFVSQQIPTIDTTGGSGGGGIGP